MIQRERIYELLGIDAEGDWRGGIQRFKGVPYGNIQEVAFILGESFLNSGQNFSPTVGEFLEVLEEDAESTSFNGYVVSSTRDDERVSIEAVTTLPTHGNIMFLRHADDFDLEDEYLYAWWD